MHEGSRKFINSLRDMKNLKIYGELEHKVVLECANLTNVLELNFGDYVLEFSDSNYTIFLSSSSASINFIWDGVLYSEEKLLNYLDYNDNYIRQVDLLGISYASKFSMFTDQVSSLLPGFILVFDAHKNLIYSASWFDCYTDNSSTYSLTQLQSCLQSYFKENIVFY